MYQYSRKGGMGYTPAPRVGAASLPPALGYTPAPRVGAASLPPALGYTPAPRVGAASLPPGLGWTGGFTIPDNEQRFSMQTCSGSAAVPMDPSADLICGRSAELNYLNTIGCVPVGFRGFHHCFTDDDNEGVFHCCPPGVLDREMARAAGEDQQQSDTSEQESPIPAGVLLGISALAVTAMGWVLYTHWKDDSRERQQFEALQQQRMGQ